VPGTRRLIVPLVALLLVVGGIWVAIMAFDIKPRLGLDLRGGTSVTFRPHNPNGGQPTKQQVDTTIDIIRNRVNSKGVAESEVTSEGGNIVVSIPDVKNSDDVIRAVGTTAQLQFRPVLGAATANDPKYKQAPFNAVDCATQETWLGKDKPGQPTVLCVSQSGQQRPDANATKLQMGPVALGGTDITGAHAELQTTGGQNSVATGQWQTRLDVTSAGDRKFKELTGKAACAPENDPKRQIAIILDSVVINDPPVASDVVCNQGITGGGAIVGQSESEAKFLAPLISTGALPLTLENIDQNTVSATLGADSLRAGLIAGALGLILTFLYVLLYYRGLGLVIWGGLAIAAALNVGVVLLMGRTIGFTLTLAGIAGLIVAIGISADSYVVFFERLKDEVRDGRTLRTSVDRGWERSFHTLVSANSVSFFAAVILYLLAIGPVRGFAFTLGLATLVDFVAVWCYGRSAVSLLTRTRLFQEGRFVGIRAAV
jgi:preprotein translocase subunit SecD